jgi:glycosyltransferase involved in cell wall biosynthesis
MRCVYATENWGVHDERWMLALTEVGFEPVAVSRGTDDDEEFRAKVEAAAFDGGGRAPVLAGPLHTVTHPLIGINTRLVGLSWGYDVPEMADLSWLIHLDALILDSQVNIDTVTNADYPFGRITFLPWGVDLQVFTTTGPKGTIGAIPEGQRIILSLRAHEPKYRITEILDGFAILAADLEDVNLVIGHSGSHSKALREQARHLSVRQRVHFIGTVSENDLPELLRGADCYVSASEVDGTSVTLLQAMACGTPAVVSDIDGNRGWVTEGKTGRLFRTGDAGDLASAIRRSLDETSTADAARALVEREADWHANIARLRPALTGS